MKRIWVLLTCLLAGCAMLPQTPPPGMPVQVGVPPVRVGAEWAYTAHDGYTHLPRGTYAYRVSAVRGDTITVDVTHGKKQWQDLYTRSWAWLQRPLTNLPLLRYSPPLAALPFPLYAGKSWTSYVTATNPVTHRSYRVRIDGWVRGWQLIKVPAGEFETLKIEQRLYPENYGLFRSGDMIHNFDWYSPRLGIVVRREGSSYYINTGVACRIAECNIVRKNWTVYELTHYREGGK